MINELFRISHTIKGSAAVVSRDDISSVAHKMEDVLSVCREGKIEITESFISLLFKGIDKIKEIVDSITKDQKEVVDVSDIINEFSSLYSHLDLPKKEEIKKELSEEDVLDLLSIEKLSKDEKKELKNSVEKDQDVFRLYFKIIATVPMKSMKMLLIEEKLKKHGKIIKTIPEYEYLDKAANINVNCAILFISVENEKIIKEDILVDGVINTAIERLDTKIILKKFKDITSEELPAKEDSKQKTIEGKIVEEKKTKKDILSEPNVNHNPVELSTVRIDIKKLDSLMNLAGELVITKSRFAQLVSEFNKQIGVEKEIVQKCFDMEMLIERLMKDLRKIDLITKDIHSKNLFVDIKRDITQIHSFLEQLRDYVLEDREVTSIHMLDETTGDLSKISSDIQAGVMQIRMVPIEGVFTRFKRTVRDLSKEMNKKVDLVIIGEDTELDKKIIDFLGDPLTHMIRNAIGHGIETMEERASAGKSEKAVITLRASREGNYVCVEIIDDGRGIDLEKIIEIAIEKNMVTAQQSKNLTDKEKLNFIFYTGFSTAKEVTDVSGRGVGLDVVKDLIKNVKGLLDIETEKGKGTKFIIKIPLTLAIIQALLITVEEQTFAIPLEGVVEIIKVDRDSIYSVDGNDTVKLREHALSLVDLFGVINLKSVKPKENSEENNSVKEDKKIVVISDGMQQLGLSVDSLIGEEEIVIKSLTEHFANVKGIGGASILGDGRIALILDPLSIIREAS
ncbi:chemotaxis protein CheA [bacterium]|nr:chemotaxis protein CheA [bacterium]